MTTEKYESQNPFASCKDIVEVLKKIDWLLAEGKLPIEEHKIIGQALLRVYDFGLDAGTEIARKLLEIPEERKETEK